MNTPTFRGRGPAARHNGGFALIEALIAILIFSIAVLGLVGLQVSMSRAQTGAKFRADAAFLANDLIGTMWSDAANRSAYLNTNCPSHTPCLSWQGRLQAALPGSSYKIEPDPGASEVTNITITWQVPNEGQHQFVTSTTIVMNAPN
jgi:type IV pilus assembly protein PilV